jgi:adenosylcobyric acid synthase
LGICGGYQMLGHSVSDPDGIEGPAGETPGLGLLDISTLMTPDKRLSRVTATHADSGLDVAGYEIHIGRSEGPDCARPFAHIDNRPEGAISPDGRIIGSYLHGMFTSDAFRTAFLSGLGINSRMQAHSALIDQTLDALAEHVETHIDISELLKLAR